MNLMSLTAVELGKKIKSGEVTAVDATKAALEQIKKLDGTYNCYVTVDEEAALAEASEVQKKIEAGELTGPLAGVPVAIKDNMCTEGMLTTCSSRILYNFKPTYSAEAVLNLKKAGAVVIGKTNMDEFAMGSTTETFDIILQCRCKVIGLSLYGSAVLRIIGSDCFQNRCTVSHIFTNRSDLIQRRTISDQSITGYSSVSRFDTGNAAEGTWLTDRSAGIRTQCKGAFLSSNCRTASA